MGRAKQIKKKKMDRGGNLFFYVMVALPILQFVIFYIFANFNSILLSFQEYTLEDGVYRLQWAGFENFVTIGGEWQRQAWLRGTVLNSVKYLLANVIVVMPLTLLFAYFIFKKFRGYGFFRILLFMPSIICNMVIVIFFRDFVEWVIRPVVQIVTSSEISTLWGADGSRATAPLLVLYILLGFSTTILLYLNAMSSISSSVLEAAVIDGASELRVFWNIVLPSIWGTIVSLFVIAVSGLGLEQANLYSLYGSTAPESQRTIGYHIFNMVASSSGTDMTQYPKASAYGLIVTAVVAPLTLVCRYLLLKFGPMED